MAGKDNVIADALSRSPPATSTSDCFPINSCVVATEAALASITDDCRSDPAYRQIVEAFQQNRHLSDLPVDHPARHLKQVWDNISITDDGILVVEGNKLYLPPGARTSTLRRLHDSHCGYRKTLQTARDLYFWPSMKHDIRIMIDKCEACQQLRPSKPIEPFITTTASFPMEQISIDLFHVKGKTYMVTSDRYSGYIWGIRSDQRDQGTKTITNNLEKITRIFGIPLRCRTDGGPQFRKPFNDYCKERGILHETSSPYNPRSNGHAEAAVKDAKHLLIKTAPVEFLDALAAWRNTSREDKPSPNELMFCRKVRDGKAVIKSHLKLKTPKKFISKFRGNHAWNTAYIIKGIKVICNNCPVSEFQVNFDKGTACVFRIRTPNVGTLRHA